MARYLLQVSNFAMLPLPGRIAPNAKVMKTGHLCV
jgi:hypothetical protein